MPVSALRNGIYCDTIKDAVAPLKIRACLGVKVIVQSCLPFLLSLDHAFVAAD